MRKKGDLIDLELLVIGTTWADSGFKRPLIFYNFHAQPYLRFTENGQKKEKKNPSEL